MSNKSKMVHTMADK